MPGYATICVANLCKKQSRDIKKMLKGVTVDPRQPTSYGVVDVIGCLNMDLNEKCL